MGNNKCDICGEEERLPFKCRYCGGTFCGNHRLPENHDCPGLRVVDKSQIKYSQPPTNYYNTQRSYNKPNGIKKFINNVKRSYYRTNPFIKYGLMLFVSIVAIYLIIINTQVISGNDETTLMLMSYSILASIILFALLGLYSILRLIQSSVQFIFKRRVSFLVTVISIAVIIVLLYFAIPVLSQLTGSITQGPIIGTWTAYESITGTDMSDTITFYSNGTFYNKKYQSPLFVSPYVHDLFGTWTKENDNYYKLTWIDSGQNIMGQYYSNEESCQLYYYTDSNTFVFPLIISPPSVGPYPPTVIFKKNWL